MKAERMRRCSEWQVQTYLAKDGFPLGRGVRHLCAPLLPNSSKPGTRTLRWAARTRPLRDVSLTSSPPTSSTAQQQRLHTLRR